MAVHPQTIGVTELRRRVSEVIEQLQESHEPLIVTAHGKSVAVLLNVEDYQALLTPMTPEEEQEIREGIARAQEQFAAGRGIPPEEALAYLERRWAEQEERPNESED